MPKVLISDKLSNQAKKIFKKHGIETFTNIDMSPKELEDV